MASYLSGTRRAEQLIDATRKLSYQENYSYTEGWDNNTLVSILNLAQERLYKALTQVDDPANVVEVTIDAVSGQQAYDLPIDVFMALRLIDVRYIYGTQSYEFVTLRQGPISDRFSYPTNYPLIYSIRNRQILLSPTPSESKSGAIVLNVQKRMRSLDIRRGRVSSYTEDGSGLNVVFTLNFTVNSQKDAELYENGNSVLDKIDHCCIVDSNGSSVVDAIPLRSFNSSTFALTADPTYSIPTSEKTALDAAIAAGTDLYVVQGDYATTHSEIDRVSEPFLIEYMILRLLRLQSAAEPTEKQIETEQAVLSQLVWSFRRYRPSISPLRYQKTSQVMNRPYGPWGA